ncbi:MFS transporter [Lentilactobacillus fungorum]|uniref:MFS transporter n=2 Tax=Lentilactobacillus fungorum TaxID=2201250 RepID=A0ABQ3W1A5_9LACO|nr:MFS transporter [Lentilactobacillus fungorum]
MTRKTNTNTHIMAGQTKNRLIIIVAGLGMLLSTLDTGIINVALPFLQHQFQSTTSTTALSVVGYTTSLAVLILPLGYLSDRVGRLKVSLAGLLIFGFGSILCGLATNILSLIIFRIIQGIGAAALQSTSAALITTLMDKDKISSALGILGIMIGLGPILGPSIGGFLLALNAWQLIFWLNVPFAILGIICNQRLLNQVHESTTRNKFDLLGSIINALMIICLLAGFSFLSKSSDFKLAIILITCGVGLALGFYFFEIKSNNPLIDFHLFSETPKIWLFLLQTAVFGFTSAIIFLIPPFLFEKIMHIGVGTTGLLVLGAPAGLVIFSRISGNQNDGTKSQTFSRWGLIIIALAFISLVLVNTHWPAIITGCLFLFGIGGGYFQPANIATIMQSGSSTHQGAIGSLQRMIQNIAIASGTAIGSTLINQTTPNLQKGILYNWIVAMVLVLLILTIDFMVSHPSIKKAKQPALK